MPDSISITEHHSSDINRNDSFKDLFFCCLKMHVVLVKHSAAV